MTEPRPQIFPAVPPAIPASALSYASGSPTDLPGKTRGMLIALAVMHLVLAGLFGLQGVGAFFSMFWERYSPRAVFALLALGMLLLTAMNGLCGMLLLRRSAQGWRGIQILSTLLCLLDLVLAGLATGMIVHAKHAQDE